ncbi:MAG: oligoendopeptidase F [Clostridia bacterium]|nr:oligoendopeptidase F [Clostridia bacterium]
MERKEIAENLKWKAEDIFPSDEAWEAEFSALEAKYANADFSKYQGKLGEKESFLAFNAFVDEFSQRAEKLHLYAHMNNDVDVRVSKYNAYGSKILMLYSKVSAATAFVEPELTALPESVLNAYIADPELSEYDYQLRRIAAGKAHVLSENEEKLLALGSEAMDGFRSVFMMLDNANLNLGKASFNGEETQMTHGLYGVVLHSENRKEREEWFKGYYQAYINLIDAITQTYYGNVKKDVFYKTARKHESCLSMALYGEDVSPVVYENLIQAVHEALPVMHRYISLRKTVLGYDEQHMYDIYAPLVEGAEIKLPFDEGYDLVVKGLAPLGKDYQELLMRGKNERWIDVCENEGKRSGAYSTGVYGVHPYVLLNYQPTTNQLFTVAHEMGHALHTYMSNSAQPYNKSSYKIFLAEIASTVNEVLLLKYLCASTEDKNLKKYLLSYYMDTIRATLFRQTQFAEFEQIMHAKVEAGEPLTKEILCDGYYKLNQEYYGEGIVHDKEISYEWARIPHFYTSFYVYKYATGIISAISIVKKILTEGESAVQGYFEFLSSGGSTDPVSILKKAGVDLTTKAPFEAAMKEFEETLTEFEKLV